MKRRIGGSALTGLGGGGPPLMDGIPTEDKNLNKLVSECAKDAYETFFKGTRTDEGYCDAQVSEDEVRVGVEPSYMYSPLKMISISRVKECSTFVDGYAWGAWASSINKRTRYYMDLTRGCKFKRFVDKWHPQFFPES